jgi:hypothetical protein
MKNRNRRAKFAATAVEYLGIAGGDIAGKPIVTLTFRPSPEHNFTALNFVVNRATLERMQEDIAYVLSHSPLMQAAPGREAGISLDDLEGRETFDPDEPCDGR